MRTTLKQALRFGAVGVANTVTGLLAIYGVIYFFAFSPAAANAIGYAIGLVLSFALNRLWTFEDRRAAHEVLPRYLLAAAISYLLNLMTVLFGTHRVGLGPYLVQLFGVCVYTVSMFTICKYFVFREQKCSDAL